MAWDGAVITQTDVVNALIYELGLYNRFSFVGLPQWAGAPFDESDIMKGDEEVPVCGRAMIFKEGMEREGTGRRKVRSNALCDEARKYFRAQDREGKLRYAVCDSTRADAIDSEIVELHHTEPVYDMGPNGRQINIAEFNFEALLVPLCPTCHRIAHTQRPPLTVEQIVTLRSGLL